MKKHFFALCVGLIAFAAPAVQAASIDCTKARTYVEKLVCSDEEISQEDDKLYTLYLAAKMQTGNSEDFRKFVKSNWKQLQKCKTRESVLAWYKKSIALYSSLAGAEASQPPRDMIIKTTHKEQLDKKGPGYEVHVKFDCPDDPRLARIATQRTDKSFSEGVRSVRDLIKDVPLNDLGEDIAVFQQNTTWNINGNTAAVIDECWKALLPAPGSQWLETCVYYLPTLNPIALPDLFKQPDAAKKKIIQLITKGHPDRDLSDVPSDNLVRHFSFSKKGMTVYFYGFDLGPGRITEVEEQFIPLEMLVEYGLTSYWNELDR